MTSPLHRAAHVGHLFGPLVDEQHHEVHVGVVGLDRVGDLLHDRGLAGLGRRDDQAALALADRREQVDDARGQVVLVAGHLEVEPRVGEQRREVLEAGAVAGLLGVEARDRVDAQQRRVLLVVRRRPAGALDVVALAQREAAGLADRDVDVLGRGQVAARSAGTRSPRRAGRACPSPRPARPSRAAPGRRPGARRPGRRARGPGAGGCAGCRRRRRPGCGSGCSGCSGCSGSGGSGCPGWPRALVLRRSGADAWSAPSASSGGSTKTAGPESPVPAASVEVGGRRAGGLGRGRRGTGVGARRRRSVRPRRRRSSPRRSRRRRWRTGYAGPAWCRWPRRGPRPRCSAGAVGPRSRRWRRGSGQ